MRTPHAAKFLNAALVFSEDDFIDTINLFSSKLHYTSLAMEGHHNSGDDDDGVPVHVFTDGSILTERNGKYVVMATDDDIYDFLVETNDEDPFYCFQFNKTLKKMARILDEYSYGDDDDDDDDDGNNLLTINGPMVFEMKEANELIFHAFNKIQKTENINNSQ